MSMQTVHSPKDCSVGVIPLFPVGVCGGVSNSIPWGTHLKGLWFSSSLPLPHPCQRREQLAVVGLPKGAFGAAQLSLKECEFQDLS